MKQRDGKAWREYRSKVYEAFLFGRAPPQEAVEDMRRILGDEAKHAMNKAKQSQARVDALQAEILQLEAVDVSTFPN